jgi:hypothetical protein
MQIHSSSIFGHVVLDRPVNRLLSTVPCLFSYCCNVSPRERAIDLAEARKNKMTPWLRNHSLHSHVLVLKNEVTACAARCQNNANLIATRRQTFDHFSTLSAITWAYRSDCGLFQKYSLVSRFHSFFALNRPGSSPPCLVRVGWK